MQGQTNTTNIKSAMSVFIIAVLSMSLASTLASAESWELRTAAEEVKGTRAIEAGKLDKGIYVAPMCCDIPGTLYDKDGNILCHLDGRMTSLGKDQCPEFYDDRSTGVLVWRDSKLDRGE